MTDASDTIAWYRGKRIDELTRDEAIQAVRELGRAWARLNTPDAIEARVLGEVEQLKRSADGGSD